MAEYIEKDALLQLVEARERDTCNGDLSCLQMQRMVERIPTAEVEPVRHGEWLHTTTEDDWGATFPRWECSCCGYACQSNPHGEHFCPACGARMDGGADNG